LTSRPARSVPRGVLACRDRGGAEALAADDVEEVEIQRSLRLLDVRAEDDRGITRYFVAYSWVERINGSPWQRRPR
jgi:hypothetical protein